MLHCIFDRFSAIRMDCGFDGPFRTIRVNLCDRDIKVRSQHTTTITQTLHKCQRTVILIVTVPGTAKTSSPTTWSGLEKSFSWENTLNATAAKTARMEDPIANPAPMLNRHEAWLHKSEAKTINVDIWLTEPMTSKTFKAKMTFGEKEKH